MTFSRSTQPLTKPSSAMPVSPNAAAFDFASTSFSSKVASPKPASVAVSAIRQRWTVTPSELVISIPTRSSFPVVCFAEHASASSSIVTPVERRTTTAGPSPMCTSIVFQPCPASTTDEAAWITSCFVS